MEDFLFNSSTRVKLGGSIFDGNIYAQLEGLSSDLGKQIIEIDFTYAMLAATSESRISSN